MEVRRGQKVFLNENFLRVQFERKIDTAAFLQGDDVKVAEEDFVFYGNPNHASGGVSHLDDDSVEINLQKIPARIKKISFTATIYDAEKRKQNFSKVSGATLKIFSTSTGAEILSFTPEKFNIETAIVLGEIYRYKGEWKFNAVGAGFNGGLAALCKNFGIEVTEDLSPPQEQIETQNISAPKIAMPPQPKQIELQRGSRYKLKTVNGKLGIVEINLKWSTPRKSKKNIDLDLCCLYELSDEYVGAVQALGNFFGSLNDEPYIKLNRDDRSGQTYNGETLKINGKFIKKIRRILVFTTIYSGTANWNDAQAVVTINNQGAEFVIKLDEFGSSKPTCALVLLENVGNTFAVEKIINFYYDSQEMDEDFDWGLEWTSGSKD